MSKKTSSADVDAALNSLSRTALQVKRERDVLLAAAKAYIHEIDDPVRDYALINMRRQQLREAVVEAEKP
jgi:hypothetical protein